MAKRKKQDEHVDRRIKRRFNIEQGLRYKLLYGSRVAEAGNGRTLNISSSGVWFTTEGILSTGLPVELSMTWPARLNDVCPMKLMIYGCVVRSDKDGAPWRSNATNSVRRGPLPCRCTRKPVFACLHSVG